MTVFTWTPQEISNAGLHGDQFNTSWCQPTAECILCGEAMEPGQKAFSWDGYKPAVILAHADCVKGAARGLIKDIAECTR